MYRKAIEKLYGWKESKRRKPLIIEKVGKTWLLEKKSYKNVVYINFDSNSRMAELFSRSGYRAFDHGN